MGLESFKNKFDLDGLIRVQPGVTREKVKEAARMLEASRRSRVEEARVAELLNSTDLGFSIAHLASIDLIPQLPSKLLSIDGLAAERKVKDFRPAVLRGIISGDGVEGAGVDADGAASVVPEGTPYPHVTVSNDDEAYYSALRKRGFRLDVTFEAVINDTLGEIEDMPAQFLTTVVKTHYSEIFTALQTATLGLTGVTLIDGTVVPVNAPVSAVALIAAAAEIEARQVNGNEIGEISKYNVIVPVGKKKLLEYDIAKFLNVIVIQDGVYTRGPDASVNALLPNVEIIESAKVTGTQWIMYPAPGTTERPVLERLTLRGYETPEIRVRSDQGFYPGGGNVGIWQGGFDADTASFRLRMFTGAVLWDEKYVVKSTGAGA